MMRHLRSRYPVRHRAYPLCSSSDGGFTLIEILVALAILALLVGLIPQALRLTGRAAMLEAGASRGEQILAALQFLDTRLKAVLPLSERDSTGLTSLVFSGTPETIRFVSPARTGPEGGGIYRFELGPVSGEEGAGEVRGLMLRQSQWHPEKDRASTVWTQELVPDDARVRLRYFGAAQQRTAPLWAVTWQRTDAMPLMIEITIEDTRMGRSQRLIVAPMVDMP